MLTLEEAIKQYEQFVNICENHSPTEESHEVIEQLAAELREWREPSIVDNCEGCVKEFDKRYLLVIKQLAAWLRELRDRRKAPEIVRCGECANQYKPTCPFGIWINTPNDGYCHLAERRTDE